MTDTKKFWLTTFGYLVVFWMAPIISFNPLFGFFDNILSNYNITFPSVLIYFFIIVPIIILLSYLFIRKLIFKHNIILFISIYILLPYISALSFFFYAVMYASTHFKPF